MQGENNFDKWPLVLDVNYQFKPINRNGIISIDQDEQIIVACPGSVIKSISMPHETFKCSRNNQFTRPNNRKAVNFSSLRCQNVSMESFKQTDINLDN
jgi:hypothetical protein